MTVAELIERLQGCDPEAIVVVSKKYSGTLIELEYVDEDTFNNEVKLQGHE